MFTVDDIVEGVREMAAEASAVVTPMLAVAAAGEAGVSAVGITTGLAALGFGSMLMGVGVVGLIGVGTYHLVKKVTE